MQPFYEVQQMHVAGDWGAHSLNALPQVYQSRPPESTVVDDPAIAVAALCSTT